MVKNSKYEKTVRDMFWQKVLCAFAYDPPARMYGTSVGEADYKAMEKLGIFVKDKPQMTAYCPRCRDETPVEVHRDENGKTSYWRICCFPIKRIHPKTFRVWQVKAEPMIEMFREKTGIKGTITELIPGQVWKWGRRGRQSFLYIRRVTENDIKQVAAVLKRFPESIFITPRTCYLNTLGIVLSNQSIAWDTVSSLNEDYSVQLDLEKIEAVLEPDVKADAVRQRRRVEKIDRLVSAMKEHYQTAKDYYYASGGEILRRPTQADLAKRIGTGQDIVSRCLKDDKAVLLKTLWNNAENPRAFLDS
jgi:hypothetical protein